MEGFHGFLCEEEVSGRDLRGVVDTEHGGVCICGLYYIASKGSLTPISIFTKNYPSILLFRPRNLTVSNFFITALLPGNAFV